MPLERKVIFGQFTKRTDFQPNESIPAEERLIPVTANGTNSNDLEVKSEDAISSVEPNHFPFPTWWNETFIDESADHAVLQQDHFPPNHSEPIRPSGSKLPTSADSPELQRLRKWQTQIRQQAESTPS